MDDSRKRGASEAMNGMINSACSLCEIRKLISAASGTWTCSNSVSGMGGPSSRADVSFGRENGRNVVESGLYAGVLLLDPHVIDSSSKRGKVRSKPSIQLGSLQRVASAVIFRYRKDGVTKARCLVSSTRFNKAGACGVQSRSLEVCIRRVSRYEK